MELISPKAWGGVVFQYVDSNYYTVFPVQYQRRAGIRYIYQSPFIPWQNIYGCSPEKNQKDKTLNAMRDHFGYWAKLRLDQEVDLPQFAVRKLPTYQLKLDNAYEELLKKYNRNRKRCLHRARISNLQISEAIDPETALKNHRLYVNPKIEYRLIDHFYDHWKKIIKWLLDTGNGILINAKNDHGEIVASAIFVITDRLVLYYFASSSPEGRDLGAPTLLIDHIIQKFAGTPRMLDLLGSEMENLAYFKRSFGAELSFHYEISYNNLPRPIRIMQKIRKKLFGRNRIHN